MYGGRGNFYFLVNRSSDNRCFATIGVKNKVSDSVIFFLPHPSQVELRCSLAKSYLSRDESSDESEQGLVVTGLFIEGASLDLDQECLVEPT